MTGGQRGTAALTVLVDRSPDAPTHAAAIA
jgi:hypothetical protein